MIKRLINIFKAYHKFPLNIASDARTKALSGRGALPAVFLPAINRNVENNVNSHGVSNFAIESRADDPEIDASTITSAAVEVFGPISQ